MRQAAATRVKPTKSTDPTIGADAGRQRDNAARVALIERSLLVLLLIGLFVGVLAVVKPFMTAMLFGMSVATAGWPVRQALVHRGLGRGMAATLLLLASLALIALPLLIVAPNLVEQLTDGIERMQAYFAVSPAQPEWIGGVPLVGHHLSRAWTRLVESQGNLEVLAAPYIGSIEQMVIAAARALADSVIQVILSLIIATVFWLNGDALVSVLHESLRRLGGATGELTLDVAGLAIRGVAYGVLGTAAIQALLLTMGLAVAGIPGATMLGFVGLLLAVSQIGAPLIVLIWGGAAWWLFALDYPVWGGLMIAWGLVVSTIDNFIKPWLIGFGVQMPLSLTLLGVLGGFATFGFLGLFIGPTLIAVLFTLLQAWREAAADS
jgi:predicted PurR-regulated permease PerM